MRFNRHDALWALAILAVLGMFCVAIALLF